MVGRSSPGGSYLSNMAGLIGLAAIPSGPGPAPLMAKISGYQQQIAYQNEADALGQQSTYAYKYGLEQAAQNDYAVQKTMGTQAARFGAAGVTLSGSPLGILTETQQLGNVVSSMYKEQGTLQSNLLQEQGLQMLRAGSAAAFGGQATAISDQYNYEVQKAQAVDAAIGGAIGSTFSAIGGGIGGALGAPAGFGLLGGIGGALKGF
jgi:hypothetical protein